MITFVQATTNDIGIVKDLAYKIWPDAYREILSEKQLAYMLDAFYSESTLLDNVQNKGHQFLLAMEADKYIGFASYEHHFQNNRVCRLHKIYLLSETQGKGFGKLLLDQVCLIALQYNMTTVSLNVNRFNKALFFYKKYGFEIVAEEDIKLEHGYLMEDYVMELKL
jgi:GNAT superfamily N-acetyltransferase